MFKLLHIYLIFAVIQVITTNEILSKPSTNIAVISSKHSQEKSNSDHQNNEKGESKQKESNNLASEGLLGLDILLIDDKALISNITNYNHNLYSFFKLKLKTPPPEI